MGELDNPYTFYEDADYHLNDWNHFNAVSLNEFDEILLSSRNWCEIYVIAYNWGDGNNGPWEFCWEITTHSCPPAFNEASLIVEILNYADDIPRLQLHSDFNGIEDTEPVVRTGNGGRLNRRDYFCTPSGNMITSPGIIPLKA